MASYFEVWQSDISIMLTSQLWGLLDMSMEIHKITQMKKPEIEYAWRAFDLWLTSTPPYPQANFEPHIKEKIKYSFENNLKHVYPESICFHIVTLFFHAIMKTDPFYAGKFGLMTFCKTIEKHFNNTKYIRSWKAVCRDYAICFKHENPVLKSEFEKGIMEERISAQKNSFFDISLEKMGLDSKCSYNISVEKKFIETIKKNIMNADKIKSEVEQSTKNMNKRKKLDYQIQEYSVIKH